MSDCKLQLRLRVQLLQALNQFNWTAAFSVALWALKFGRELCALKVVSFDLSCVVLWTEFWFLAQVKLKFGLYCKLK